MVSSVQGPRKPPSGEANSKKLDQIVAKARKEADARMAGYREFGRARLDILFKI